MNTDLQQAKGYYCIVQYVPDIERTEGVNVGVILFCPDKHFMEVMLSRNNNRVRHFFDPKPGSNLDLTRIKTLKMAFQERIAFEKGRIKTQEDFRAFISSRGNHLLLTEPRPIKILNPEEELFQLFNRLVDSNPNKAQNSGMKERIKELDGQFEAQINKQGIDGLMKRKVVLAIPLLGRTGEYSFGFQNGQQNVIKTVVFKSNNQKNVDNACVIAIEGRNLADANVKLNVLAEYDASEDDHVPKILESTGVRLIAADRMEEFAIEIKKTAH